MAQKTGRAVPAEPLTEHTIETTGRTVRLRKLSVLFRGEIRKQVAADPAFKKPDPPVYRGDYGDGEVDIVNAKHPQYLIALQEWEQRIGEESGLRLVDLIVRRGIVVDDDEIDREAVAAVRADMEAIGVSVKHMDDREVYVRFVCVGVEADWFALVDAVFSKSAPQEAAVQAHVDTFPGPVQGA